MIAWKCQLLRSVTLIGTKCICLNVECNHCRLISRWFRLSVFWRGAGGYRPFVRTQITPTEHSGIVCRLRSGRKEEEDVEQPLQGFFCCCWFFLLLVALIDLFYWLQSVSEALQRKWRPMKTAELDGAIVDPALHGWDSYVLGRLNWFDPIQNDHKEEIKRPRNE